MNEKDIQWLNEHGYYVGWNCDDSFPEVPDEV